MTIGDRIKQRRMELGMSQEELARKYKDLTEERKAVFWKRIIKTIEATNETKKNPKVIFL